QKTYPSGKIVVVNKIPAGGVFGEVAIFSSKNTFPSTVVASLDTKIMFLAKTDIIEICFQNKKFLNNLLHLLSEKILILDHKLHFLSGENIRQKLCLYLIESYEKQETLTIRLDMSKRKMAEQFGITRPSLSRELMLMKKEGLIDYGNTYIIIQNLQALEHYL
ncbi:MAG TPA: Crp/Fnr family transcriptional regulator, partial [Atribacterota bacterium]|nr:Crp/Fnr family transcriptional regulator [Atribacterota bacterium]